ncbi:hypothetical protein DF018_13320 [Burkholderia cenocepacia]|nr:hypothetical protein DF018_13320 [Burkholderia cenocepacia]
MISGATGFFQVTVNQFPRATSGATGGVLTRKARDDDSAIMRELAPREGGFIVRKHRDVFVCFHFAVRTLTLRGVNCSRWRAH